MVGRVAEAMGAAAARAPGWRSSTGDTKVVDAGHGDGVYVNTAGIGLIPDGVDIRPQRAAPGDVVIVSGAIGVHGIAIMSVREGLEFGVEIESDSAALQRLVAAMLAVTPDLHVLRDPTRGGLATSLNEIAAAAGVGVALDRAGAAGAPRRSPTPARCSGWTRCTSPTRASWWRSCRARTRTPCSPRCGAIRWARRRR